MKKDVLIVAPALKRKGGVANFFKIICPHLGIGYTLFQLPESRNHKVRLQNFLRTYVKFTKELSKGYSMVHLNPSLSPFSFFRDALLIYAAKKKSIPVLVFFRGWQEQFAKRIDTLFYPFFKVTYSKADYFLVLASDFRQKLVKWKINPNRIGLFTTAFDGQMIRGLDIYEKATELATTASINVLFLARLEREKGIFETIKAIEILIERGLPVKLLIAGDGRAMNLVKEKVTGSCIKDEIKILSYIEGFEKVSAFRKSHIYCFPTYHGEGMPASLLEAMAFGLAVITRPVGGIKDFFQNNKMGILTESKEPEVLAELIAKLLNDRQNLAKIAKYNHEYALRNFSSPNVARKLVEHYNKIIA